MARDEPKSAKGSSMIGAFVTQIATMTVHVLHGKTQSVLNTNHRLLTSKRQLHVSAGLDHMWVVFLSRGRNLGLRCFSVG